MELQTMAYKVVTKHLVLVTTINIFFIHLNNLGASARPFAVGVVEKDDHDDGKPCDTAEQ